MQGNAPQAALEIFSKIIPINRIIRKVKGIRRALKRLQLETLRKNNNQIKKWIEITRKRMVSLENSVDQESEEVLKFANSLREREVASWLLHGEEELKKLENQNLSILALFDKASSSFVSAIQGVDATEKHYHHYDKFLEFFIRKLNLEVKELREMRTQEFWS